MTFSIPTIVGLAALFLLGVGFYALLMVRNLIKVMVGLQLLGKGAVLALVLAGYLRGQVNLAQSMALTVIVVGLALAVQVRRHFGTLDLKALTTLRK
jgi:multisubunit Na+/H+ antiporter MnhC subunit